MQAYPAKKRESLTLDGSRDSYEYESNEEKQYDTLETSQIKEEIYKDKKAIDEMIKNYNNLAIQCKTLTEQYEQAQKQREDLIKDLEVF